MDTSKWKGEALKHIRILAEASTMYTKYGQPQFHKNWDMGFEKIKETHPDSYKLLKKFPIKQIQAAWAKYHNAAYGFCSTPDCPNKAMEGDVYCASCATSGYHRGIYSNPSVKANMDIAKNVIENLPEKALKDFLIRNIEQMKFTPRRELLGDEFKKQLYEKESKKHKKK